MTTLLSEDPNRLRPAPPNPQQGVIEEAKRRQRMRWRRRIGGAVAVGAAAVLLAAIGSPSSPAAKHHDGGPSAGGLVDVRDAASVGVRLSPSLDGGGYGWCVGIEEPGTQRLGGGGCGGVHPDRITPDHERALDCLGPNTLGDDRRARPPPRVTAVLVDHRRVPTAALPGLPGGLRVVRIRLPLATFRTPSGRLGVSEPREPSLIPLDHQGDALARTPESSLPLPKPSATSQGPCSLRAKGLVGLRPLWSHLASAIVPYPGAVKGQAFFSCIDTEFRFQGSSLDVAVLLDAAHPGSSPGAIPGLAPVEGDGAYVNGPGLFKGPLTATRSGNAWLVVAGGGSLAQRIEVLRHVKASI